ncbi:MAG TPA: hypothetical protein VE996_13505 [Terriglobales bacterium]|nr:hypothetical protein [Terriglobales bacterium]
MRRRAGRQRPAALLARGQAGQAVGVRCPRDGVRRQAQLTLAAGEKRSFRLQLLPDPGPLQAAILQRWLRRALPQ